MYHRYFWGGVGLVTLLAMNGFLTPTRGQAKAGKAKEKDLGDYKITLYEHDDYKGRSLIVRTGVLDLRAGEFDNRTTSLRWNLPAGRAAVLCADKNFQRPVLVIVGKGELPDLSKSHPNAQDSITSIANVPCKKGAWPKGVSKDVPRVGEEPE